MQALPDTGDLEADLQLVLRATVAELTDPRYDAPMRALAVEIAHDDALAGLWAERVDEPLRQGKLARLRSAQRSGELPGDLDLELAADLIWGPLQHRWLLRTGPLTPEYSDAVVSASLSGLRSRP